MVYLRTHEIRTEDKNEIAITCYSWNIFLYLKLQKMRLKTHEIRPDAESETAKTCHSLFFKNCGKWYQRHMKLELKIFRGWKTKEWPAHW